MNWKNAVAELRTEPPQRKAARIFLVQSPADASAAAQCAKDTDCVVALTPSAMFALEQRGRAFQIPEDYCPRETVFEVGMSNYHRARQIASQIDNVLDQFAGDSAELGVKPGECSFQAIKNFLDVLCVRALELHHLVRAYSASEIVSWTCRPTLALPDGRIGGEATYSTIVDRVRFGVAHRSAGDPTDQTAGSARLGWKEWIAAFPRLFGAVSAWRWQGYKLPALLRTIYPRPRAVLLVGDGYGWYEFAGILASAGYSFLRVPEQHPYWFKEGVHRLPPATAQACLQELESRSDFLSLFELEDLFIYSAFRPWLQTLLARVAGACWEAAARVSTMVRRSRVQCVVTASLVAPTGVAIAAACRQQGLPILTWQHGGAGHCYNPSFRYQDLDIADIYLAWGPGVKSCYEADATETGTDIRVIGSVYPTRKRLDVTFQVKKSGRRILYATTNYYEDRLYVSLKPAFSDRLFWRTQRAILDVLGQQCAKDDEIIVKLHPNPRCSAPPLEEQARAAGYRIRFIVSERTFLDLAQEADATIVDWPQTTLMEALATDAHLFIYTGHVELLPQARTLLGKRACVADELNHFIELIEAYLKGGTLPRVDRADRSFLNEYATPQDKNKMESSLLYLVNAVKSRSRHGAALDSQRD